MRDEEKNITNRVTQPTPDEIRLARMRAGLTQSEAAMMVSSAGGNRTWQGWEAPVGTKGHRSIPLAAWELFLLLTDQHPVWSFGVLV